MFKQCIIFVIIALSAVQGGILPAYVAPYASSYNAHTVNHAVASPIIQSAPLVSAPAVISSPYVAEPYSAYPAYPLSAYSYPYVL